MHSEDRLPSLGTRLRMRSLEASIRDPSEKKTHAFKESSQKLKEKETSIENNICDKRPKNLLSSINRHSCNKCAPYSPHTKATQDHSFTRILTKASEEASVELQNEYPRFGMKKEGKYYRMKMSNQKIIPPNNPNDVRERGDSGSNFDLTKELSLDKVEKQPTKYQSFKIDLSKISKQRFPVLKKHPQRTKDPFRCKNEISKASKNKDWSHLSNISNIKNLKNRSISRTRDERLPVRKLNRLNLHVNTRSFESIPSKTDPSYLADDSSSVDLDKLLAISAKKKELFTTELDIQLPKLRKESGESLSGEKGPSCRLEGAQEEPFIFGRQRASARPSNSSTLLELKDRLEESSPHKKKGSLRGGLDTRVFHSPFTSSLPNTASNQPNPSIQDKLRFCEKMIKEIKEECNLQNQDKSFEKPAHKDTGKVVYPPILPSIRPKKVRKTPNSEKTPSTKISNFNAINKPSRSQSQKRQPKNKSIHPDEFIIEVPSSYSKDQNGNQQEEIKKEDLEKSIDPALQNSYILNVIVRPLEIIIIEEKYKSNFQTKNDSYLLKTSSEPSEIEALTACYLKNLYKELIPCLEEVDSRASSPISPASPTSPTNPSFQPSSIRQRQQEIETDIKNTAEDYLEKIYRDCLSNLSVPCQPILKSGSSFQPENNLFPSSFETCSLKGKFNSRVELSKGSLEIHKKSDQAQEGNCADSQEYLRQIYKELSKQEANQFYVNINFIKEELTDFGDELKPENKLIPSSLESSCVEKSEQSQLSEERKEFAKNYLKEVYTNCVAKQPPPKGFYYSIHDMVFLKEELAESEIQKVDEEYAKEYLHDAYENCLKKLFVDRNGHRPVQHNPFTAFNSNPSDEPNQSSFESGSMRIRKRANTSSTVQNLNIGLPQEPPNQIEIVHQTKTSRPGTQRLPCNQTSCESILVDDAKSEGPKIRVKPKEPKEEKPMISISFFPKDSLTGSRRDPPLGGFRKRSTKKSSVDSDAKKSKEDELRMSMIKSSQIFDRDKIRNLKQSRVVIPSSNSDLSKIQAGTMANSSVLNPGSEVSVILGGKHTNPYLSPSKNEDDQIKLLDELLQTRVFAPSPERRIGYQYVESFLPEKDLSEISRSLEIFESIDSRKTINSQIYVEYAEPKFVKGVDPGREAIFKTGDGSQTSNNTGKPRTNQILRRRNQTMGDMNAILGNLKDIPKTRFPNANDPVATFKKTRVGNGPYDFLINSFEGDACGDYEHLVMGLEDWGKVWFKDTKKKINKIGEIDVFKTLVSTKSQRDFDVNLRMIEESELNRKNEELKGQLAESGSFDCEVDLKELNKQTTPGDSSKPKPKTYKLHNPVLNPMLGIPKDKDIKKLSSLYEDENENSCSDNTNFKKKSTVSKEKFNFKRSEEESSNRIFDSLELNGSIGQSSKVIKKQSTMKIPSTINQFSLRGSSKKLSVPPNMVEGKVAKSSESLSQDQSKDSQSEQNSKPPPSSKSSKPSKSSQSSQSSETDKASSKSSKTSSSKSSSSQSVSESESGSSSKSSESESDVESGASLDADYNSRLILTGITVFEGNQGEIKGIRCLYALEGSLLQGCIQGEETPCSSHCSFDEVSRPTEWYCEVAGERIKGLKLGLMDGRFYSFGDNSYHNHSTLYHYKIIQKRFGLCQTGFTEDGVLGCLAFRQV